MSIRGKEWNDFSKAVLEHIEEYAVLQYGDKGENEQVSSWSTEDCIKAIQQYCARHKKNQRTGNDTLDLIKIAHYAQIAFEKMTP